MMLFSQYYWSRGQQIPIKEGDKRYVLFPSQKENNLDCDINIKDVVLDQQHYGFLAQDVQKLFPELVHEDGAGYLSVNYVELIPLLVQAVQELRIQELETQIAK